MKFELKNISYNSRLSEETAAYSATLFIDGKKAGTVSNHGHGGCDNQHLEKWVDLAAVEAYIKANHPPLESEFGSDPIPCDLELLCARLLDEHLLGKAIKSKLSKNHVVLFDKQVLSWPKAKIAPAHLEQFKAELSKRYPGYVLLNDRPIEVAIAAWKEAGLVA